MRPTGLVQERVTRGFGHMALLACLFGLLPPIPAFAQQPTAPAPQSAENATKPPTEVARKAWHEELARRPLPANGCFTAKYPSTEWQQVPCGAPSKYPNQQPVKRAGPNTVGDTSGDFDAQSSGLISSATGSFRSVNGASSVSGFVGGGSTADPNVFMLQLNTQFFNNPPACNSHAGCLGWEQFLFSQTQCGPPGPGQSSVVSGTTACVFIEYWLINYGATCPAGQPWISDGSGDCWFNGPSNYVPPQTVGDLADMVMTASANVSGKDRVTLTTSGGTAVSQQGQGTILSLGNYWNTAEFNVFGDCCSTETSFSAPTTLVVQTSIDDGTTNPPACATPSFTAETNNLTLAPTASPVCCPYGGATPSIEFMESDAGHTATCGPTSLEGDPHITTVDGTRYDFQGAGEFVALRDTDGAEIQTRQEPAPTSFIGTDSYDGLTTCVSVNTAVAARVGGHRVTYEPNISGVPDPTGLQLRIDGVLTTLNAQGMALGVGGRVVPLPGGALQVVFPDGKILLVTPEWWASQSLWYLNEDISKLGLEGGAGTSSSGGLAGPIPEGSWLPALPGGGSMGPMPGPAAERYAALYERFANAWRVRDRDTLFDYAPGTSTRSFTNTDWPKQRPPCDVPRLKPEPPVAESVAQAACRRITDAGRRANCVFDVMLTGDLGFGASYRTTQRILTYSTTTSLSAAEKVSQPGEWVAFTARVVPNGSGGLGPASGTVQFAVDGVNAGEPVTVDAKGQATWETSHLKLGASQIVASYQPAADSLFLPSTSLATVHEVRRCGCTLGEAK